MTIRGKWGILDEKVESGLFHIWSSEGGSPPPVSIEDRSSGPGEQD
jgi:hypothetical protein